MKSQNSIDEMYVDVALKKQKQRKEPKTKKEYNSKYYLSHGGAETQVRCPTCGKMVRPSNMRIHERSKLHLSVLAWKNEKENES